MALLKVNQGPNPGQVLPIEGESIVLGRHPDCDIVLESGAVSRQHARIWRIIGDFYVEDLHSRNGTFVNGRAVVDRQLLSDNDELGICEMTLTFHGESADPGSQPTVSQKPDSETSSLVIEDDDSGSSSRIMTQVDISSGSTSLQLEVNTQAKLQALIEISQNLGKAVGLGEVLPNILDSLFVIFRQADRGFVILKDAKSGKLVPMGVKYRRETDAETIRISRTIVDGAMETRKAILSADAATDARFDMAESIVDFQIRSMMCAPLVNRDGEALGVIQIDTLDRRSRFSEEDLDVLASVACQAAFAVENAQLHEMDLKKKAIDHELAVAHKVQQGLLPAGRPEIEEYEFFDFYDSANELGGDYYDYVPMPGGRLGIVVADVSGKGIAASLLMAKLSAETHSCLVGASTPAEAVSRLNRTFCGSRWEDRFVTLVLVVLDPQRHEVTIVNAGHLPPLLRRGSAEVEAVAEEETRLPLGVDPDVDYEPLTLLLQPGDSLTLYTDGITEAMNDRNDLYGQRRLWTQLASDTELVGALGQAVLDDVKRFVGRQSQSDDMCLACFGRGWVAESG